MKDKNMATASAIAIKHAEAQEEHAKAAQVQADALLEQAATMKRIEDKLDALIELLTPKTGDGGDSAAPATAGESAPAKPAGSGNSAASAKNANK